MSYSINISGHKETSGMEESKAFEEDVVAKAKELVKNLEGVSSALASTGHLGQVNLMEE